MDRIADSVYRSFGWGHSTASAWLREGVSRVARQQAGQGTVEYIGLVLLLAAVMAAVVTTGNGKSIGMTVISKVKDAISAVGG